MDPPVPPPVLGADEGDGEGSADGGGAVGADGGEAAGVAGAVGVVVGVVGVESLDEVVVVVGVVGVGSVVVVGIVDVAVSVVVVVVVGVAVGVDVSLVVAAPSGVGLGAVSATAAAAGIDATATPAANTAARRRTRLTSRRSPTWARPAATITSGDVGSGKAMATPPEAMSVNCAPGWSTTPSGTAKRARQSMCPESTSGTAPAVGGVPAARSRCVQLRNAGCTLSLAPNRTTRLGLPGGAIPLPSRVSIQTAAQMSSTGA
jgi:hypothetical protein